MTTKVVETSSRPTHMYRVVYEHLETRKIYTIYVESTSSYEAGEGVLAQVGEQEHDLILAARAKPFEMH